VLNPWVLLPEYVKAYIQFISLDILEEKEFKKRYI
jgi:hypothetical protein